MASHISRLESWTLVQVLLKQAGAVFCHVCDGAATKTSLILNWILQWRRHVGHPHNLSLYCILLTFSEHRHHHDLTCSCSIPSFSPSFTASHLSRLSPSIDLILNKSVWLMYYWSRANLICLIREWLWDAHMVEDKDKMRGGGGLVGGRDYISWVKFYLCRQGWEQVIMRNGLIWSHKYLSWGYECFNFIFRVYFKVALCMF